MHELKTKYPAMWKELGNTSVTKGKLPFVSIGSHHACEHHNSFFLV